jgi:hypothetical protein
MARITYSALVTRINGTIGGTTFQNNKYGYTVKSKPKTVKPNSLLQAEKKVYMSAATKAWKLLTDIQRADYDTFSQTRPQYAKNNPSVTLNGFNVFVKYHALEFLRTGDITAIKYNIGAGQDTVDTLTSISITNDGTNLDIHEVWANNTDSHYVLWFISRPFPESVNFLGSNVRYMFWTGNADGSDRITNEYKNIWGSLPPVGTKLFVEILQIEAEQPFIFGRQKYEVIVT